MHNSPLSRRKRSSNELANTMVQDIPLKVDSYISGHEVSTDCIQPKA
jgi:hypothetical protein